jgi:hypothetical protein
VPQALVSLWAADYAGSPLTGCMYSCPFASAGDVDPITAIRVHGRGFRGLVLPARDRSLMHFQGCIHREAGTGCRPVDGLAMP